EQRLPAQGRVERAAAGARCAAARRLRVHEDYQETDGIHGNSKGFLEPQCQPGLLGRREEAQRSLADADARAAARAARRDRLGPRRRRAQDRREGHQQPAQPRAVDAARHPLRAPARARRARPRARARERPHRQVRRRRARARARRARLRLGAGGGRAAVIAETLTTALERARTRLPGGDTAAARRSEALRKFAAAGLPTTRAESWRYTDLSRLDVAAFDWLPPAPDADALRRAGERLAAAELFAPARPSLARLVFVDGHYAASLSRPAPSFAEEIGTLGE